ncbi:MAG TPA: hypothetical protein EYQ31_06255, partial [Candidatus Handelsmanbacteria bacterium]|nr:hypothetical protein [Candidatus Handelsmanbacteria bacterium]
MVASLHSTQQFDVMAALAKKWPLLVCPAVSRALIGGTDPMTVTACYSLAVAGARGGVLPARDLARPVVVYAGVGGVGLAG